MVSERVFPWVSPCVPTCLGPVTSASTLDSPSLRALTVSLSEPLEEGSTHSWGDCSTQESPDTWPCAANPMVHGGKRRPGMLSAGGQGRAGSRLPQGPRTFLGSQARAPPLPEDPVCRRLQRNRLAVSPGRLLTLRRAESKGLLAHF